MAVLLVACGGDAGSGTTAELPTSTATEAPPETTAAPVSTVTTIPAGTQSKHGCQPEPRTDFSSDWTTFSPAGAVYGFSYPSSWENFSGDTRLDASQLLDATTFAETGLADDAEMVAVLVGSGTFSLGVFEWSGVTSPIEEVHHRMVARAQGLSEVQEVFFTDLAVCVAGEPGLGMHMLIDAPSTVAADSIYGQEVYLVHNGILYSLMVTSSPEDRPEAADILGEVLRSWHWLDDGAAVDSGPISGAGFLVASTADDVDLSQSGPDPTTFSTSFSSDATRVYVTYQLLPGVGGEVRVTWSFANGLVEEDSLTLPEGGWGSNWIIRPAGGFAPGDHQVILEVADAGTQLTLPFTVEP